MKRNGTTTKGTTRWRCKQCGASRTKHRPDITNTAAFTQFINHCTTGTSLTTIAHHAGCSPRTLQRRFTTFWLIDTPDPTTGHTGRIYDQIFLDGTYTAAGCLIIAATVDHVIAWHWCTHETTLDYQRLLERICPPLTAVIDGGQGAYSAIKKRWPTTRIQRCLIHTQRVVRRHTTSRPRTDAERAIYQLALNLTSITTLDQAAQWGAQLHDFATIYRAWINEKTLTKDPATGAWITTWTHPNVRKAYNSLNHLWRSNTVCLPRPTRRHTPPRPHQIHHKQPRSRHQRTIKTPGQNTPRSTWGTPTKNAGLVAVPKNRTARRPIRNRQAVQLGSGPTRQSIHPDPQREPRRPPNRTTSPLRQRYRHRIHTLNRHPKRPNLTPRHADTGHTFCRLFP